MPIWAAAELGCATWGQFFLKFILGHPQVTCVIPGMDKPRYVDDNLGAGRGRVPNADEQQLQHMLTDSPWDHQAVMDPDADSVNMRNCFNAFRLAPNMFVVCRKAHSS